MTSNILGLATVVFLLTACTSINPSGAIADADVQVMAVERAFAKTMADRDHRAFKAFLSTETVFLSGSAVTRGGDAVADQWQAFFIDEAAPFSWAPEIVEVLDSGMLAISTGPVWDAKGQRIATYTSIWRQEEPGVWRIVFDRGNRYCQ